MTGTLMLVTLFALIGARLVAYARLAHKQGRGGDAIIDGVLGGGSWLLVFVCLNLLVNGGQV